MRINYFEEEVTCNHTSFNHVRLYDEYLLNLESHLLCPESALMRVSFLAMGYINMEGTLTVSPWTDAFVTMSILLRVFKLMFLVKSSD